MAIFNLWSFILYVYGFLLTFYFVNNERTFCKADNFVPQASRIKLEDGQYNGIFFAIDGDKIDAANCPKIIEQLNIILPLFSDKLHQATDGRASLGQVNLLLPINWNHMVCRLPNASFIQDADASNSYYQSHIQITEGHPMTANNTLPWTKQYRPCGQPGDSIIVPCPFLLDNSSSSTGLSDSIKAQLLLHEWTKFRYGAFDEFGYDDEESLPGKNLFSPCYTQDKQAHFSCCTNSSELSAVALNASACSLEFLLGYEDKLRRTLAQGSTSVMSSPYIESVTKYCADNNHNRWSLTKQNLYCDRRSVSDVVFAHSDFSTTSTVSTSDDSLHNSAQIIPAPTLRIWKHPRKFDSAYAFVIQDTTEMHKQYDMQHVKRAIAQFLQILDYGTEVAIVTFSKTGIIVSGNNQLRSDTEKQEFLNLIPDVNNSRNRVHVSSEISADPWPSSRLIAPVTEHVVTTLSTMQTNNWNVFFFAQNSPGVVDPERDMRDALTIFKNTSHTISLFTFDSGPAVSNSSSLWLLWYGIPHTKNVATLPSCSNPVPPGPCNFQTSSFMIDHFVGILNDQPFSEIPSGRRFLQSPVGTVNVQNKAATQTQFELKGYNETPSLVKSVHILLSVPENSHSEPGSHVKLINPMGQVCIASRLLTYLGVWTFSVNFNGSGSCTFNDGVWGLRIEQPVPSTDALQLNVWVELGSTTASGDNGLKITSSLGSDLKKAVESAAGFTSIFVNLQTDKGFPVLNAQVSVSVYSGSEITAKAIGRNIILRDDGDSENGADQTGNDGVYTAYLNGVFDRDPAFYVMVLNIETTAESKVLETTKPSKAVLLDTKITKKCCGKVIQVSSAQPIRQLRFQTLHLGFQTVGSPGAAEFRFPPGRIGQIEVQDELDISTVRFIAVAPEVAGGGGQGDTVVCSYQVCCVPANSTVNVAALNPPGEPNCKADTMACGDQYQSPGVFQTCTIQKKTLVNQYVSVDEREQVDHLVCAIRAVNTKSEFGQLSAKTFDMYVKSTIEILQTEADGQPCRTFSLSKKCLPIWIFWVLIGCLGFLIVILVVVICWWYCTGCQKQKKTASDTQSKENILAVHYTPPPGPITSSNRSPKASNKSNKHDNDDDAEPKVVKELFVNHAYIQDGDGEIKIIANNGKLFNDPRTNTGGQRRETRISMQSPLPLQDDNNNPNMHIFKPVPMPKSSMTLMQPPKDETRSRSDKRGDRPGIIHQNQMLRSDSSSLNTISKNLPPQQPPKSALRSPTHINISSEPPINYATINRTGRHSMKASGKQSPKQVTFDPHYMVPHNSMNARIAGLPPQAPSRHTRDPLFPRSLPPQLPHYPTTMSDSDSSTTEDGRYGQQQRPRRVPPRFTKPPPYPTGSQLVKNNDIVQQQRYVQQHPLQGNVGPRGIVGGSRQGDSPVQSLPPPIPPPRFDRPIPKTTTLSVHNPGSMQSFSNKLDTMLSDDDDSDEWDDGDNSYEIYNTTNEVSYA